MTDIPPNDWEALKRAVGPVDVSARQPESSEDEPPAGEVKAAAKELQEPVETPAATADAPTDPNPPARTRSTRPRPTAPAPRSTPPAVVPVAHRSAGAALAAVVGRSGVDGIPASYDDGKQWLIHGLRRHPRGVLVALVLSWTGTWLAFWGAAFGAVLGILIAVGATSSGHGLGVALGQSVTPLAVVGGFFIGAAGGFLLVLRAIYANHPLQPLIALVTGFVAAALLMLMIATYERLGLRLRGYRRLSRDEVRRVAPLVKDVAEAMNLDGLPRFAIADLAIPNAWAHMRTIVLTTGLLQTLDDAELQAILAHELHHWHSGDSVGSRLVWCAAWPIALTVNIGRYLAGGEYGGDLGKSVPRIQKGIVYLIGWGIAWPGWLMLKYVVVPIAASTKRRYEYEADAAAASLGLAAPLSSALRKMGAFESGRTGWEQAMAATHPPTELRVEVLQQPKPDDAVYQEDELRGPTRAELKRLLTPFVPRRESRSHSPAH